MQVARHITRKEYPVDPHFLRGQKSAMAISHPLGFTESIAFYILFDFFITLDVVVVFCLLDSIGSFVCVSVCCICKHKINPMVVDLVHKVFVFFEGVCL